VSNYLKSIKAILANDYLRRTKVCEFCGVEFCDVTKRNLKHTCTDKCRFDLMVKKRKERDNYKHTGDHNEKIRISVNNTYSSREVFTPEIRNQLSISGKKAWAEGRMIFHTIHWTKTSEGKERLSELNSGRIFSNEHHTNLSLAQQNRIRTKQETLYTSAKGGTRKDLNKYFRSNWEANFARILNYENKIWFYECCTFQIENNVSYTPDFYLLDEDKFVELKGRMDERSKHKLDMMQLKFPWIKIELIEGKDYNELRKKYKSLLENWEGK
jgi:hypothetical protein